MLLSRLVSLCFQEEDERRRVKEEAERKKREVMDFQKKEHKHTRHIHTLFTYQISNLSTTFSSFPISTLSSFPKNEQRSPGRARDAYRGGGGRKGTTASWGAECGKPMDGWLQIQWENMSRICFIYFFKHFLFSNQEDALIRTVSLLALAILLFFSGKGQRPLWTSSFKNDPQASTSRSRSRLTSKTTLNPQKNKTLFQKEDLRIRAFRRSKRRPSARRCWRSAPRNADSGRGRRAETEKFWFLWGHFIGFLETLWFLGSLKFEAIIQMKKLTIPKRRFCHAGGATPLGSVGGGAPADHRGGSKAWLGLRWMHEFWQVLWMIFSTGFK